MILNLFLLSQFVSASAYSELSQQPKNLSQILKEIEDTLTHQPNGSCSLLFSKVQDKEQIRRLVSQTRMRDFALATSLEGLDELFQVPNGASVYNNRQFLKTSPRSNQFIEQIANEMGYGKSIAPRTSWEMSLFPLELQRRIGLHFSEIQSDFYSFGKVGDLFEYSNFMKEPKPLGGAISDYRKALEEGLNVILKVADDTVIRDLGKPNRVTLAALCAQYGVLQAPACMRALEQILRDMSPHSTQKPGFGSTVTQSLITMPETITRFLWKTENIEAIRGAAFEIWSLVQKNEAPKEGHLFELLYRHFQRVGFNTKEAEDQTWEFLGIYSTRGTNIGNTIAQFGYSFANGGARVPFEIAGYSFATIAHCTGILDAMRLEQGGRMFSYPPEIVSELDNSKPYHFWMSAYLAREGTRTTGNKEAGKNAAWLAQLGYQMKSETNGRDPTRAFQVDPYDPANNKIRMDLTYAAAGAVYGSRRAQNLTVPALDLNEGLRELILAGEPLLPLSKLDAAKQWEGIGESGYFRWKKIFNPDYILKKFDP